ncbi:MAG: galactokinase, partial [bacterium]
LDLLVSLTRKMDFVYGARMMGGGFGGCTINLLNKTDIDPFRHLVGTGYATETGTKPEIYFVSIEDGAHILTP